MAPDRPPHLLWSSIRSTGNTRVALRHDKPQRLSNPPNPHGRFLSHRRTITLPRHRIILPKRQETSNPHTTTLRSDTTLRTLPQTHSCRQLPRTIPPAQYSIHSLKAKESDIVGHRIRCIFDLAGIIWAAHKRRWALLAFPVAYYLAFIVLFLKISTVYLIPTLPFLSILSSLLLFEVFDRVPKIGNPKALKTTLFAILIVALIASSLFLVTTQSPSDSQQAALSFVGGLGSPKVITSATYIWLLKQNYPNVTVLDRYTVPWSTLNSSTVYLIVDLPGDFTTINSIPQYQSAFNNSTIVASYNYYNYLVQVRSATIP